MSTYKKIMAEAFGVVKEGKIEQRELKLFIDNDSRLYRQRFLPIMRNLSNKMSKDRYKASLAERAFMYLVNDGVKKYISDYGGDKDTFSKADLKAVAKEYVQEFEDAYDNEEYDFMGKKIMKILEDYKKIARELLFEVDDEKIIKYKDEDGESKEMKAGSAKTMPDEHPAKQAYNKMKDDGGDDKEKPSGQKISGSDFDRDGGDDSDKDSDSGDGEKSAKSDNEDINGELEDLVISSKQKFRYFDVEKSQEGHAVVRGDVKDDLDQQMSVAAVEDGDGISYVINMGRGSEGTPINFDSKEEAMEAAKKLLDDETIRDTMNGDGDPKHTVLADLDQHAKNVLLPDDHPDKPIPADPSYMWRTGKELDKKNESFLKEQLERIGGGKY